MLPGKDTNKDEVLYNTANAKILRNKKMGDYVDYEEID
jgi:hypothetical protein